MTNHFSRPLLEAVTMTEHFKLKAMIAWERAVWHVSLRLCVKIQMSIESCCHNINTNHSKCTFFFRVSEVLSNDFVCRAIGGDIPGWMSNFKGQYQKKENSSPERSHCPHLCTQMWIMCVLWFQPRHLCRQVLTEIQRGKENVFSPQKKGTCSSKTFLSAFLQTCTLGCSSVLTSNKIVLEQLLMLHLIWNKTGY